MLNCMTCGNPTIFTVRRGEIQAAFCPKHIPEENIVMKIVVRV